MPDPTSRPGRLENQLGADADQRRLSTPRMMSGQFPDEIIGPAIRELEKKLGIALDRDAIRARLEQEIGFADYSKYSIQRLDEFARLLEQEGLRFYTGTKTYGIMTPADIRDFRRRLLPEPGPQSGLLGVPRGSVAAYAPPTPAADEAPAPALSPLSPALAARVQALLSQRDLTSPASLA